jgi:hypothetical protein
MSTTTPKKRYATTAIHSRGYYRSVLLALLDGLKRHLSNHAVADELNEKKIPSPTGLPWTEEKIKGLYKRIRHHNHYPTKFYAALLECAFWGEISQAQALPLLIQRRRLGTM